MPQRESKNFSFSEAVLKPGLTKFAKSLRKEQEMISWKCHGVTESTEPVGKRATFQMRYPHLEGNNFSRPFEGVAP